MYILVLYNTFLLGCWSNECQTPNFGTTHIACDYCGVHKSIGVGVGEDLKRIYICACYADTIQTHNTPVVLCHVVDTI